MRIPVLPVYSPTAEGWRGERDRNQHTVIERGHAENHNSEQWLTLRIVFANTHTISVHLQIDIALLYRHNQIDGSGSEISKQPWGGWVAENTVFLHYAGSL